MTFYWPLAFWLLLIPLALFARDLIRRRGAATNTQPKILQAEVRNSSLVLRPRAFQRAANDRVGGRIRVLLYLGLAFASVAIARPQWGKLEEPAFDQAREIVIALDLSRSMQAQDIKPSRLDRARLLITSLLERLKGERVGLIVFSGTAFLQSPLSSDYEILRDFLPLLNPDYLPEGGTNYNALLETTVDAFGETNAADRFLIVLSDGEAQSDDWHNYIAQLKTKGIRVLSLGIGTGAGSMVPDGSGAFIKDERGAVVLSKLNPATLRELAEKTDGVYADASEWVDLAQLIEATVDQGKRGEFKEKTKVRLAERFQWPLAAGILLFLLSFWREFPVTPKPRAIQLAAAGATVSGTGTATARVTSGSTPATTRIVALAAGLLGLAAFFYAQPASAQTPSTLPDPVPPSSTESAAASLAAPVLQSISRLAANPQRSAKDYADVAQATVAYGDRAKSSNETVPEGAVRDALAAAQAGEALDPKAADWPSLKKQLNTLLPKKDPPPPPKKDDKKQDDKKPEDKKGDKGEKGDKGDKGQKGDKGDPSKPGQQPQPDAEKGDGKSSPQDQKGQPGQQPKDPSKPGESPEGKPGDGKPGAGSSGGQKGDQSTSETPPSNKPPSGEPPTDAFGKMNPDDSKNPADPKDPKNPSAGAKPTPKPDNAAPKPSENPPGSEPRSGEMQQVGGASNAASNDPARLDPAMSVPMQRLDKVKEYDSPARLFQLLQGPPTDQPAAKGKDW